MHAYLEEVLKLEHISNYNKNLHTILDSKYDNVDLNKFMKEQCQHLT